MSWATRRFAAVAGLGEAARMAGLGSEEASAATGEGGREALVVLARDC